MDHTAGFRIEPIGKHHRRDSFDCGELTLTQYLQRFARQNHVRNIAKAFVAVDSSDEILGYCTLSAASVAFENLPTSHIKRLPKYPISVARLGRLAVSIAHQNLGMGGILLYDAMWRAHKAAESMGVKALLVDALHEKAKRFYIHFGFIELVHQPLSLLLPIETIERLILERDG